MLSAKDRLDVLVQLRGPDPETGLWQAGLQLTALLWLSMAAIPYLCARHCFCALAICEFSRGTHGKSYPIKAERTQGLCLTFHCYCDRVPNINNFRVERVTSELPVHRPASLTWTAAAGAKPGAPEHSLPVATQTPRVPDRGERCSFSLLLCGLE